MCPAGTELKLVDLNVEPVTFDHFMWADAVFFSAMAVQKVSLMEHLGSFSKGLLDTRPIMYYLSITLICLFLTGRVISSPRWRS